MWGAAKSPSWTCLDYAKGCDDKAVEDLTRAGVLR
jgi:hypothetical protein